MNNNRQKQNNNDDGWWYYNRKRKKREEALKSSAKPMSSSLPSVNFGLTTSAIPQVKNRKHLYTTRQWKIRSSFYSSTVQPEELYYLRSQILEKDLIYTIDAIGKGMDLVWELKLAAKPNISFEPGSGIQEPIRFNQTIAVCMGGPDGKVYLHYSNKLTEKKALSLSKNPKYEWQFRGKKDEKLKCDKRVSLFNTIAGDYLVFKEDVDGAGLTWYLNR